MKKLRFILAILLVFLSATCILVACNKDNEGDNLPPATYTIQYVDDSGTHNISVSTGELYSLDSIPSKKGYEFIGLFDAEQGGTQYVHSNGSAIAAFTDNRNLVLYPQFKPKEYTLVLDYGQAAVTGSRQIKVNYGQALPDLPINLTVENKNFAGWYTQADKKGTQVADKFGLIPQNSILTEETFDLSDTRGFVYLYAGFKGEEFTVRFYYGNDPTPEEVLVEYGTYISEVITTRRVDGKAAISWTKASGSDEVFTGKVECEMILYAYEYAPVIEFNANGGNSVNPIIAKSGSSITLPTPTRENYKFAGWYTSGGSKYTSTLMGTESVSLTARWNPILIFNTNGGTEVEDISAEVGTRVTLPTTSKDGFMFAGWYTEQGQEYTATSMPQNSVKLVAKYWKVESKKIVVIEATKTQGTYNTPTVPDMTNANHTIDLSDLYEKGIRSIKVTAYYTVWYQWSGSSLSGNPDTATAYMSWYSHPSASDAYKVWNYSDSFRKHDTTKKNAVYSKDVNLNSSKLYVCRYQSYGTSYGSSTHANWTDFWVKIEYPDMSKLY